MPWWDFYKLWTYNFEQGPLEKQRNITKGKPSGAGIGMPEAIPDLRGEAWGGGPRGSIRLHDSNDFIDLSTVTNRLARYKEYERLRNLAEIEMAMTVIAEEACVGANTKVATVWDGYVKIAKLAREWKKNPKPFLVYAWDFDKDDYTLAWAYEPRFVKKAKTIRVTFHDGTQLIATDDHRVLRMDGTWIEMGGIEMYDEMKAFYKMDANRIVNKLTKNVFPRIFTYKDGWKGERQFIDEWRTGEVTKRQSRVNMAARLLEDGATTTEVERVTGIKWDRFKKWIEEAGFTMAEYRELSRKHDFKRIVNIERHDEVNVYDLSVKDHENFCTDSAGIVHNCQIGDNGHVFELKCKSQEIKKELEWLLFSRRMLNLDRRSWNYLKRLCIFGDGFYELLTNPENPKDGILGVQELPPDSMYRIETTKCRLVEFQQGKDGPDYQALTRNEVTKATEADLQQSTAIRFAPKQIVHFRIGDDRKAFYPYGQSLIEPARGPAHQLRLMEDAMVVYRLCLTGDARIRVDEGWKYIKDIRIGDITFTKEQDRTVRSRVRAVINNGEKDVYRIKSKHNDLRATGTHPVLVSRNGIIQYVDVQDLIPGRDQLINVTRESNKPVAIPRIVGEKWAKLSRGQRKLFREKKYQNKSELMRLCQSTPGRTKQFLYSEGKALPYDQATEVCDVFGLNPENLKVQNKGEIKPEKIKLPDFVDNDFARLFGFLIGDGSVRKNEYAIAFSAGSDHEVNSRYAKLLKRYFGKVGFNQERRKRKTEGLGNFCVHSVVGSRILKKMGYIPGTYAKRIPEWVFSAPKHIRIAFLEGLADADAAIKILPSGLWTAEFEMANKQLIEDIKELWHSAGLASGHIRYRERDGGHEIEPGRTMPPTKAWAVYISKKPLGEYETLESVEHAGREEVYDITVDNKEHNFIANGIPVHNTRAPERRIFYIDVGKLPPFKAEAFIEKMKDQFRKKKVARTRGGGQGANVVEERWHAPAADEDYWLPIRPNSNTRIDTLQGAQNLGEIDDALYFRNKLFTALNFPQNYFNNSDPQQTRISLSAQDVRFARMIERIQAHYVDGIIEVCERHLELRGYPEESYQDLEIRMTPPSDWREMSRSEVLQARLNFITSLKGSMIMADYDLLTRFMNMPEDEVQQIIARNTIQKLQELKLQIIGQNPQLMGVGVPGAPSGEQEMGTEAGGPSPMLGGGEPGAEEAPPGEPGVEGTPPGSEAGAGGGASPLPEVETADIKRFDLEIQNYSQQQDAEDVDYSEEE